MKTLMILTFALTASAWVASSEDLPASYDLPEGFDDITITLPAKGSVSEAKGLEAFARIYEVFTHPRCVNCHVGADNVPIWSGLGDDKPARPHGMNIKGGQSRIGAEAIPCSACHTTTTDLASLPHEPPHNGIPWHLAPVEFEWFGKSMAEICEQLKTPARNGGRDWQGLVEHLGHDASLSGPVLWGFAQNTGREPAPRSLQVHVDDMIAWGVAGQPCPPPSATN